MKIKKLLFSFLFVLSTLVVASTTITPSYAYDGIDSTGTAEWNISEEIVKENYGVYYSKATGTNKVGTSNSVDRMVNYFEMKTDGINSKLASWAYFATEYGNNYQASATPLANIAKDYEKKHPGWIVVAGINADQWYYGTTQNDPKGGYFYYKNQTYYPFTVDGQNLFTISPLGTTGNGIGITNDPTNPIVKVNAAADIELQIYDENDQLVATYPVSGYNQTPGANATTVWSGRMSENDPTSYKPRDVLATNDLYIIGNSELAFMNNSREYPSAGVYSPVDSFYGRGKISSIAKECTLNKGQFAIETTNEELKSKLKEGVKVIVNNNMHQKKRTK